MTIGNVISDNWGIFMVVGVLALIYAVCYATVCYKLKSWGSTKMVQYLLYCIFQSCACIWSLFPDDH